LKKKSAQWTDTLEETEKNFNICGPCIVMYWRNKDQQDAVFYSQFISTINLYMFRAVLLFIIRKYFSVNTTIVMCHAFMWAGC
jgi:hypothetical protein